MLIARRARLVAPGIHFAVFALTWFLYWLQPEALLNGPSRWPFLVVFLVDFPISVIAFGAMFTSDALFPYAVVGWGVLGTLEWYFIGLIFLRKRLLRD
jgi:hypothetical protein